MSIERALKIVTSSCEPYELRECADGPFRLSLFASKLAEFGSGPLGAKHRTATWSVDLTHGLVILTCRAGIAKRFGGQRFQVPLDHFEMLVRHMLKSKARFTEHSFHINAWKAFENRLTSTQKKKDENKEVDKNALKLMKPRNERGLVHSLGNFGR